MRLGIPLLLLDLGAVFGAKRQRHIDVLVPSADVALVEQQVVGDARGLGAGVPRRGLTHGIAPANQFVERGADRGREAGKLLRCYRADFRLAFRAQMGPVGFALLVQAPESLAALRSQPLRLFARQGVQIDQRHLPFHREPAHCLGVGPSESGLNLPWSSKLRRTMEVTRTGVAPAARTSST